MTFLWPDMLWLLTAVPALVALYVFLLRRKKKAVLRYANLSLVKEALGSGRQFRRHIPPLLFLLALVFAPLVGFIPPQATAPALIVVGVLMTGEIRSIRFEDFTEAVPAFLTMLMMPLTYSIAQGLAFGFTSYTLVKLLSGRRRENSAVTYTLAALFVLHFVLSR
jgi:hypothetical protein